jgi:proline racemase
MAWPHRLQLLDVHCEGEIGKVIIGGAPDIPGATVAQMLDHINKVDDSLRRFVVLEPRGAAAGSVNLLLPPTRPDADAGFIVLQPDQAHAMSGSNAMCVVTALLETGRVAMTEPETVVRLDTAAGLVSATAECHDGRCRRVRLDMVPAFVEALDLELATEDWGPIKADICFGGIFYALVDVDQIGLKIEPDQARALVEAGMALKGLINARYPVHHPEVPAIQGVAYVMFRDRDPDGAVRTCTTLWPGRVDRSPCGTGSSAHLAALHARGLAKPGDRLRCRSIIGSEFQVDFRGTTTAAGHQAVLPRVTGRCWTYGQQQLALDPSDPFAEGFALPDTWGPNAGEIG